jgi:hypothetical protein
VASPIELRGHRIDAIHRILGAQTRFDRSIVPQLNHCSNLNTLDAPRIIDESFRVLAI